MPNEAAIETPMKIKANNMIKIKIGALISPPNKNCTNTHS